MDVSLVLIIVMAVLFGCGVYAMLERSLTRVLIGFLLLGNAVNLLLLIVMGRPGRAPFYGIDGDMSDPLPQALTLTAIVITFAVSAFLLALIYRSWQLGKADTVEDDEADIALRERTEIEEDLMDDEVDLEDEDATTDFVGVATSPIRVLHAKDLDGLIDDAPVDRPDPIDDVSSRSASGGARSTTTAGPGSLSEDGEADRDETRRPDERPEPGEEPR
ncbi:MULTISPECIES: Na(+)/H(+) antiporter subunit C [unclassified Microbacterium]|uniref:Na(+)/H(+) antiporter subunit C n=1 Tax=unclassified Microbacterium TaxID=2609290 RepID=UPI001E6065A7|nr:Na(+)/H(+) antiporter subunit C [Microbacterium sp. Au-Mic1]MCE4025898.1 Na(+)/H(+) antiporter subunit C [Microbacterium sp. Au-Mic1]